MVFRLSRERRYLPLSFHEGGFSPIRRECLTSCSMPRVLLIKARLKILNPLKPYHGFPLIALWGSVHVRHIFIYLTRSACPQPEGHRACKTNRSL